MGTDPLLEPRFVIAHALLCADNAMDVDLDDWWRWSEKDRLSGLAVADAVLPIGKLLLEARGRS